MAGIRLPHGIDHSAIMAKFNQNDNKTDISAITGNSGVVATWHGRSILKEACAIKAQGELGEAADYN